MIVPRSGGIIDETVVKLCWILGLDAPSPQKKKYTTSSDAHHDMYISIICFHAMVRSMLPWSNELPKFDMDKRGLVRLAVKRQCPEASLLLPGS